MGFRSVGPLSAVDDVVRAGGKTTGVLDRAADRLRKGVTSFTLGTSTDKHRDARKVTAELQRRHGTQAFWFEAEPGVEVAFVSADDWDGASTPLAYFRPPQPVAYCTPCGTAWDHAEGAEDPCALCGAAATGVGVNPFG